ncbi:MAG: hypothetical protein IIA45_02395 [Bacteroidetes bacterium]|nr:hypothetical protein [Bacteroidota bacterium]
MKAIKYSLVIFCILTLFGLGFLRDIIFLDLNYFLTNIYGTNQHSFIGGSSLDIKSAVYNSVFIAKWIWTLLFSFFYLVLACAAIFLVFRKSIYVKFTALLFVAIFLFSAVITLISAYLGFYEQGFTVARRLMEFIQSPIMVMILIPAFKLIKRKSYIQRSVI